MTSWALWLLAGVLQQAEPPKELEAFDAPNDDGENVAFWWARMPYEADDVEYVIFASSKEGGPTVEAARLKSKTAYASERKIPWWAGRRSDNHHYFELDTDALAATLVEVDWPDATRVKAEIAGLAQRTEGLGKEVKELETELGELEKMANRAAVAAEIEIVKRRLDWLRANAVPWKEAKHRLELDLQSRIDSLSEGVLYYQLSVVRGAEELARSEWISAAEADNLFDGRRLHSFGLAVVFCGIIVAFIQVGKRRELFLRKIPGLAAVDEAIGRAVEMGQPVYFLPGRHDINEINTIAAVTILGEVAKKCAQLGAQLKVPHTYVLVYAVSQEITKQAYTEAGRPDAYRDDINFFITEDQFAYTAAVDGMFVRERPAAIIYMGYFYAESLILAETGASIGAIQVAGTDADHQLPFFVTACDYTLIGEELYAASAYLSKDPTLVGTLRGQDVGKLFVMAGVAGMTLLSFWFNVFGWHSAIKVVLDFVTPY